MNEKFDSKGRSIFLSLPSGYSYERVFDDSWDDMIPAEVIEYQNGARIYERHYNEVTYDKNKPVPYDAGIHPNQIKD